MFTLLWGGVTKKVVFRSTKRLSCISVTPAPTVILCLADPDLLAPRECSEGVDMPFEFSTLEATLTKSWKDESCCGSAVYSYSFSYDENLLADPDTPLTADDISEAFCVGCLTNWVEEQVGNEVSLVNNDDGTHTLITQHGCEYTFSSGGGTEVCVEDSDTIDFSLTDEDCVTGSVVLSAEPGNILQALPDGLFAEASGDLAVSDTSSVDLTLLAGTLSADVKVSADPGNDISIHADGIYSAATNLAVSDTATVDLTLAADTLSADVKISADPGNDITAHADGIYASGTNLAVSDTATVDLTLAADNLSADVKISADAGNDITAHADGIYLDVATAAAAWSLTGNAGTTPGTNYLGTSDNVALVLGINGTEVVRIQPGLLADSPDITSGASANAISGAGSLLNVICGGGGAGGSANTITDGVASAVCGGQNNDVLTSQVSFLGGGQSNSITDCDSVTLSGGTSCSVTRSDYGTIGGGNANVLVDGAGQSDYSTIGGGRSNVITSAMQAVIAGGRQNTISDSGSVNTTIAGGFNNVISGTSAASIICGGENHDIVGAQVSFIGGGEANGITDCDFATVSGGNACTITRADSAVISGGNTNTIVNGAAQSDYSVIGGGQSNSITSAQHSVISGGQSNVFSTGAYHSAIVGGRLLQLGAQSMGFQRIPSGSSLRDLSGFSGIAYFGDVDIFLGNTASAAAKLRLYEPNSSLTYTGTNYSSFEAQTQSADINYVLPAAAGAINDLLRISNVSGSTVTLEWIDPNDGWIPASGTWTYSSATVITAPAADVANMSIGDKIWIDQSGSKFFYVASASGTTITIVENTTYVLANAAIGSPYYSHAATPKGFPPTMAYTATVTGFSVAPTMPVTFSMCGRRVTIQWQTSADGTSNATTFTISLPNGLAGLSGQTWLQGANTGQDNGSYQNSVLAQIAASASVIDLYPQGGSATWTNSGNKSSTGQISYTI